ncbi:MAG TPA: ABC transporter ATP-binding protein [Verrucomicrobiae bacterium]|jgi:ABC-2 type transport system ATP-binding protein|nr:ABC transporter ATP-binding protein [Verrucomicrobiae bacterium]
MIALSHLHKKFGARVAVHELSLAVPRGEIFGLLGHNGAGKSTTIGMMLGQVWPTRGEVKVCGYDVTSHRAQALQKVGAIFEAPAFYDYLSGQRNLEILSHYTAPTSRERIRQVVEWVGLTARVQSKVRTYSHGMRARLAIAQALLPEPELLILDEPGSGLDPEGIAEMRQTIARLHRELGLTILLSSHLLGEVEQLCSRIAVLNQGRKVFEGQIADIKAGRGRIALRTPDFAAATALLRERGIITGSLDGKYITLGEGRTTAEVAKALVNANLRLDGIWHEEQTLEDFYLSLVKAAPPILH